MALVECLVELIPRHLMIVLRSGGIRGPPSTCETMESLCYEQDLLELRAVKQFKLGFSHSKPVVSFERVCHLNKVWRVCCQEVKVGGLWTLLMLFRTSCLMLINCCQPLHNDIQQCQQSLDAHWRRQWRRWRHRWMECPTTMG
jgi:hypothetical protein